MKKLMKKVIVMLTAVMMLVGLLPAAAMASGTTIDFDKATLTILKTDSVLPDPTPLEGFTFTIYKIATLDTTSLGTQLSYTVESRYEEAFTNKGYSIDTLGTLGTVELEEFANLLANNYVNGGEAKQTGSDGKAKFDITKANFGLYLVVETGVPADSDYVAGNPFFVEVPRTANDGTAWVSDVEVTPKNAKNTVTKNIVVTRNGVTKTIKADTVKPGDVINYVVTGTIPYYSETQLSNAVEFTIKDELSNGLIFDPNSANIKIDVLNKNKEVIADVTNKFTITYTSAEEGGAITSFTAVATGSSDDKNVLKMYKGYDIKVTYSAVVDNNITVSKDGLNNAQIGTKSDSVPVYTFAIKIEKNGVTNSEGETAKLEGVEFEVYYDNEGVIGDQVARDNYKTDKNPNGYVKITTDGDGIATIDTLDADYNDGKGTSYWLKEVKTNSGYTLLTKPVKVTLIPQINNEGEYTGKMTYKINDAVINNDDGQPLVVEDRIADVAITNNKGFSLPSTGGMGTYIFTVGGIVIMAAAALVLVAMKKRNRA